jgi:hypothetical protein
MRTLQTLLVGFLVAASAGAVGAAEQSSVTTITITAKRPHAGPTTDARVPPESRIEIVAPMPTDMPEAEIDYHMAPIGSAPATARVPS